MLDHVYMNIFDYFKNLDKKVRYYDSISPKPFSRGYTFNPFSVKRPVTVVWIDKDNEFDNSFKRRF